jgi:hypothetical protein
MDPCQLGSMAPGGSGCSLKAEADDEPRAACLIRSCAAVIMLVSAAVSALLTSRPIR